MTIGSRIPIFCTSCRSSLGKRMRRHKIWDFHAYMSAIHCPPKTTPGLIGSPMAVSWSGMGLGPTSDGSVEYRCSAAAFTKCASKKSVWARNLEAFECEVCFFGYWIGIDGKEMKREEVPGIPACFLSGGPEGQRSMETCPSLEAVAPGCP